MKQLCILVCLLASVHAFASENPPSDFVRDRAFNYLRETHEELDLNNFKLFGISYEYLDPPSPSKLHSKEKYTVELIDVSSERTTDDSLYYNTIIIVFDSNWGLERVHFATCERQERIAQ